MEGKTVLITGANSGIGKETTKELAKKGAKVIMACRNLESANQVREEIAKETGNENLIVMKIDLSSFQSIRDFAKEFLAKEQRLDVLIHNAGYGGAFSKHKSVDDIEITFAINHYGPFLLTHLLIDVLKKSAPSRIIVVASDLYKLAKVNLQNLNPTTTWPAYLYYSSKGANIMFCTELARRLEGTQITANCLHPGLVDTAIWRNIPLPIKLPFNLINKMFFKTPQQGAQTSIYLASSEEVNDINGKYFIDCKDSTNTLKPYIIDSEKCKFFWEESLKIVKIQEEDPKI
ncbi:hypothetical protein PVAND_000345 [Polypedilum vanderplanki]|uniref:Uncharacterized protein n=1 Tax=Polypedilum vanderplanki TaxID=319348 RepID=A0A9J6BKN3_POLVA|nr:hypothetical protein PVAND_000345 [Polypedilum vanderplanki]